MSTVPNSSDSTPNKSSNYQYIFKLILIGSSGVGKSCILQRYMKHTFEESYKCTIGVDFLMKSVIVNGQTVKLQLWDTAGQEKYKSMVSSYYRGANVALIVFDITNRPSFEALPLWIENFYKNGPEQKNIILIGNKSHQCLWGLVRQMIHLILGLAYPQIQEHDSAYRPDYQIN